MVAPVLLKYRVCRPRLLLAGSRAEVDPAADVGLLHGEVLLIEDSARQYDPIGGESRLVRSDFILGKKETHTRIDVLLFIVLQIRTGDTEPRKSCCMQKRSITKLCAARKNCTHGPWREIIPNFTMSSFNRSRISPWSLLNIARG